jgi:putative ABC transport system permease protein
MALLFFSNSVFESSTRGLEKALVGSLTGHFALSAQGEEAYGLFGSEIPIVSSYESIPPMDDFVRIAEILDSRSDLEAFTPLVSTLAQANIGGYAINAALFGVQAESYFSVCPDIEIITGDPADLAAGGVFLNETMASNAKAALGRDLVRGEEIVFSLFVNNSFRLRKGYFAGIHRYVAPSEALDRVILADPVMVRALANYTLGYAARSGIQGEDTAAGGGTASGGSAEGEGSEPVDISPNEKNSDPSSLDDLFGDVQDLASTEEEGITLEGVEAILADTSLRDQLVMTDAAAWSFVLVRVREGAALDPIRWDVGRVLDSQGIEARVIDWYTAAGQNAMVLFALRAAFNVGVLFLLFGAVLVITNALVISVLERTGEIGSMRALGASRGFIRLLFILETMLLTLVSASLGILIGYALADYLAQGGIPIENPLLRGLFGGDRIKPLATMGLALRHLAGALIVSSLAWVYPVALALKVQPVAAMADLE